MDIGLNITRDKGCTIYLHGLHPVELRWEADCHGVQVETYNNEGKEVLAARYKIGGIEIRLFSRMRMKRGDLNHVRRAGQFPQDR